VAGDQTISTVVTSSRILEFLAERGAVRPSEIARELKLVRANVHRLLATLEGLGLLERREDGTCILTFSFFELGNTVPHSRNLIDPARPPMLKLAQESGHTVNHGVVYDDEVLFIDKVDPPAYLKLHRPIGTSQPLYCTSLGKTLLAFLPEAEREEILGRITLHPWTEHTITNRSFLEKELEEVRRKGYGVDMMELSIELNCLAAPVLDPRGTLVSAISISGVASRFDQRAMEKHLPDLLETAREISSRIT
jgi:IclR family transcriptional regulator, KDG regulon repressor